MSSTMVTLPSKMIFPESSKTTTRGLTLRNNKRHDIIVKIRVSNPALLAIGPASDVVRAGETRMFSVTYKGLPRGQINHPSISIYARSIGPQNIADRRAWIEGNSETKSQLVCHLPIVTSPTYAALETLIDLPGNAIMVESKVHPTFDADDSDTFTAKRVDCDMATAARLRHEDMVALAGDETETANIVNDNQGGVLSWLSCLYNAVFPPANGKEDTVPCGGGK
ncbi:hypothetical protein QR680_004025 [Steinernema hermaphroditum]|uniref:MSP domain-containing protein n=1 Tax=Steinernema hermaphroditum TaxID=289476 RepID=A0AA39HME9_9BILA|nr:hypothetical protein QR680_004025 [Steinernema hermaphroditum]